MVEKRVKQQSRDLKRQSVQTVMLVKMSKNWVVMRNKAAESHHLVGHVAVLVLCQKSTFVTLMMKKIQKKLKGLA